MDRSTKIELVIITYTTDDIGQQIAQATERPVFAKIGSITREEFFSAGKSGLKPACVFSINRYEYGGEKIIKYNGAFYEVYRTYEGAGEIIELYTEARAGAEATEVLDNERQG